MSANPIPGGNNIGWFETSGDSRRLIHISRFLAKGIFVTDEGGYGLVLQLKGIDPECLSLDKVAGCGSSVLQAQRLIPDRISLFQTFIKKAAQSVPHSHFADDSPNEVVRETESLRNEFIGTRAFYEISLYWTLYVHPPARRGKKSFEDDSRKMLRDLQACATNVNAELTEFGASRLDREATERFFAYLARLEDRPHTPGSDLADSSVAWHSHGIVLNQGTTHARYAQPFSLLKRPGTPTPGILSRLLAVPAEFVIVVESRRKSLSEVRGEVGAHERFMEFFKHNPLVLLFHRNKALPKSAASSAADASLEIGGLGGIIHDIQRGMAYCTCSLIGLVHAASEERLGDAMSSIHRVFGASEATVLEEGFGALSAYQAMFPGAVTSGNLVKSLNVRRYWLREDHVANLSLWFAPQPGSARSETLEDESLCVLETRSGTTYSFDQFASGPRGVIVTGEPRRGKTFFVNFTVDHEMKYGGYVFIYDIGGAYENVTLKHGGTVVKVGLHGPRLNLFSLSNTEANRNQTARLVIILLERGGAKLTPQDETSIRASVAAIYALEDPSLRRLRYLILSPALQPYLSKWIQGGVYGEVFDNAEDELRLSRIVSFDFEGLSGTDQAVLMEPLLFWIRLRVNELVRAEGNMALPKLEVYDEVWRLIQNESVLASIFETMKTAGKKLGGIILATQDTNDLGPHAGVIRNACPDAVFLGGAFSREQYQDLFGMNETQLNIIPTLRRGEMLLLRRDHSLVVRLVVDESSKWLYSTHPQDVRRRTEAIREHGREKAFEVLALSGTSK